MGTVYPGNGFFEIGRYGILLKYMTEHEHPTDESGIEKIFEAPAKLLEEGLEFAEREKSILINKKPFRAAEEYWNTLGPGLTTGAADDDPAGIATYSQTGAQYGPQFL